MSDPAQRRVRGPSTLTDAQAAAVKRIKQWFENETEHQPVFRLFGYAGTGKTTITKHAIGELNLDMGGLTPDVRFGAFTGKASYVMRKHGTPARTIHSLIYSVREATEEEIEKAKTKLTELETEALNLAGLERTIADAQITALRTEIKEMKKPKFGLNPDSDVRDCKLIVLDEVSMVGPEMAADLLSFGKPILVLGDPGQLPPIRGEGAFTQQAPDMMLTEIHRQAAESAVIRLASMARQGQPIPYGKHDEFVWKLSRRDVTPENLLNGGQVICGRNATRYELNNAMRRAAGFDHRSPLPTSPKEKLICLKNDGTRNLINGMFVEMADAHEVVSPSGFSDGTRFSAVVVTEEGDLVGGLDRRGNQQRQLVYAGHFLDHIALDPDRHERDWKLKKGLIEATFGWAITCHKAQGSQWENVIVWDDGLGRTAEDRARWLYTAITRAESGLVILD
jgi:exodeoxyribonuclease-5